MSAPQVAVIGAGIAGLVAARQLHRQGIDATVYEAGPNVAGMAASHTDADGFSYDLGAHFVTNRLVAAIGCGDWQVVRRYGEVVYLDGEVLGYPNGLLRKPGFVTSALRARLAPHRESATTASEWFRRSYGTALADEVALPLVAAWAGCSPSQLSAAVGDKIPGSMLETALLRLSGRVTRRAVAIGYCREQAQSAAVFHVYPRGGVAQLCEAIADQLGDRVRVNTPVHAVQVSDGAVASIVTGDGEQAVDAVVSTVPINRLAQMVHGWPAIERFRPFRFRPIRALNLKLDGRGLLPDTLTWTPHGFSFFRLSESTWSMPWLAPPGKTMVLVELNAVPGDDDWDRPLDQLTSRVLRELTRLVPDIEQRLLGVREHRLPLAYPVFALDYEQDRADLERRGTGVWNLLSIGRNGEFAHLLMEDSYWRTVRAMSSLGASLLSRP